MNIRTVPPSSRPGGLLFIFLSLFIPVCGHTLLHQRWRGEHCKRKSASAGVFILVFLAASQLFIVLDLFLFGNPKFPPLKTRKDDEREKRKKKRHSERQRRVIRKSYILRKISMAGGIGKPNALGCQRGIARARARGSGRGRERGEGGRKRFVRIARTWVHTSHPSRLTM